MKISKIAHHVDVQKKQKSYLMLSRCRDGFVYDKQQWRHESVLVTLNFYHDWGKYLTCCWPYKEVQRHLNAHKHYRSERSTWVFVTFMIFRCVINARRCNKLISRRITLRGCLGSSISRQTWIARCVHVDPACVLVYRIWRFCMAYSTKVDAWKGFESAPNSRSAVFYCCT